MSINKNADELIESPGQASSELIIEDLMHRDERIDSLLATIERKSDEGNKLQSRVEMISSKLEEQLPYWKKSSLEEAMEKANEELEKLSNEVDDLYSQLTDLAFSQGRIKRELRHGAGMLGSSDNPYDIHGDVDLIEQDLESDRKQPSWNIRNLFESSTLDVAEASMVRGLVSISNDLDSKGLIKEADIIDSIIIKILR